MKTTTNKIEFNPYTIHDLIASTFHAPRGWYLAQWIEGKPLYLKIASKPFGIRRDLNTKGKSHV